MMKYFYKRLLVGLLLITINTQAIETFQSAKRSFNADLRGLLGGNYPFRPVDKKNFDE